MTEYGIGGLYLDPGEELEPVHDRHSQIEDDDRGNVSLDQGQPLPSILGEEEVVPLPFEVLRHRLSYWRLVVDDKHIRISHGSLLQRVT